MLEDIVMAATPDFTDFGQFLSDEVDIADWCAVSVFVDYSLPAVLRI